MNYFIFDGESSLDYGVYIGGQNTFNAPQRDVEKVAIPGRNGDLIQDNGRFLNVQVPYNIVVMDSFRDKTDAIKAWLLSKKGYCKLVDTYHPGTYRMAMVVGGIDFETAAYNLTGRTQVIFDCKPERFLDSGDEVFNVGEAGQSESASGSMATFEGDEDEVFAKMQTSISPTQNLNGYDYPWPAGGGKNLAALQPRGSYRGMTFTVNDDGSMTIQGTTTQSGGLYINGGSFADNTSPLLPAGDYVASLDGFPDTVGSNSRLVLNCKDEDNNLVSFDNDTLAAGSSPIRPPRTLTATRPFKFALYFYANAGDVWDYTIRLQLEAGTSASSYSPYSNICPITGQTGASVYRTGRNLFTTGGTPGGSSTNNGVTFSYNTDGTITLNGRNNGSSMSVSTHMANFRLPPGTYKKPILRERVGVYVQRKVSSSVWETVSGGSIASTTFAITEDDAQYDLAVRIGVGGGLDFDFDNFVCEPYIYKNGEQPIYEKPNYTRYPISWQTEAGAVYGGTVDVVSGLLTVTMANIASYNGETIGEPWLSSMDKYAPGATPTIGAQVVYTLLSPQTYQLTGQQINTLLGTNNVWSNTGDMYVEWLLNPNIMRNPTRFDSRPKIRVKGSGSGTLTVENETIVVSNLNEYVDIDSEMMNCYKGTANKNADVALPNHEYPKLHPGANRIDFSGGVTGVEIKGRWWTI